MLSVFNNLFKSRAEAAPETYKAFSELFDEEVSAEDMLRKYASERRTARAANAAVSATLAEEIALIAAQAMKNASEIAADSVAKDTAVALLIDHSGSMRGYKQNMASIIAQAMNEFCETLSVPVEILGFTTVGWRGRPARALWFGQSNPGRLCALRHIVYRSFDDGRQPLDMSALFLPGLLKENVDGEALQWAVQRLEKRKEYKKVLIVLSDGAPVDDSTLTTNSPTILEDHLKSVVYEVAERPDFTIGSIGIGYDVSRFYSESCLVRTLQDVEHELFQFVSHLLRMADLRSGNTGSHAD